MWVARCVVIGCVIVASTGCGDDTSEPTSEPTADSSGAAESPTDETVIEYRFGDASVEPQYERNYSLTIRADEVHVVIDSDGDVLADTRRPLAAPVWAELGDGIDSVAELDPGSVDGCDGGTTRSLIITAGADTIVDIEFDVCGSTDANTDAADQTDRFVQPVIDAIPDWDRLIR